MLIIAKLKILHIFVNVVLIKHINTSDVVL